jgi:hypothetical protein
VRGIFLRSHPPTFTRPVLGFSQVALAARCQLRGWDLGWDVLAWIESGVRGISDKEIAIFSVVLGVSVQDLLPPSVSQKYVKTLKALIGRRPASTQCLSSMKKGDLHVQETP